MFPLALPQGLPGGSGRILPRWVQLGLVAPFVVPSSAAECSALLGPSARTCRTVSGGQPRHGEPGRPPSPARSLLIQTIPLPAACARRAATFPAPRLPALSVWLRFPPLAAVIPAPHLTVRDSAATPLAPYPAPTAKSRLAPPLWLGKA